MTLQNLCKILELPGEVIKEIEKYKKQHKKVIDERLHEQLKKPECWEQSITEIKNRIGEDPLGVCILAELLDYACHTYEEYNRVGIPDSVFVATMKFCTRFINEHKRVHGDYAFTWAWWFPRQLSMKEFRIGELEYEFADDDTKTINSTTVNSGIVYPKSIINIHIPSDANMNPEYIRESMEGYRAFLQGYYPEWEDAHWYCESWLLSPALRQLLPEASNIMMFQSLFDVENVDYESMAVLDWVFPGEKGELSDLSENTSLQRNMKRFLLDGNKVGWAKGIFKK